eukprot:246102_1
MSVAAKTIPVSQTGIYQRYQAEAEIYKALELQKVEKVEKRTRLDTTKNENVLLLEELQILDDDTVLYKKSGPILVKVDVEEAKTDVQAKMRIISDQIKQIDVQIKNIENKKNNKETKMAQMRQTFEQQMKQ